MGFKGGFAAFTDGFMRSMQAGEDRNRAIQDRADAKERQQKEDAYRDEQRAYEKQNREEALALKTKLKGASAPVETITPQQGPVMPGETLPDLKTSRPKMVDEELLATAKVLKEEGNLAEAIKYENLAREEVLRRSVTGFNTLLANAKDQPAKQVIDQAISIFNNDPSLGHIENQVYNPDGTVTMDVFNKNSGQRVTQTFKPVELLSGLRAHYDQAGLLLQKKEEAAAQAKLAARKESLQDQMKLIDYREKYKGAGRGVGGGGSSSSQAEAQPGVGSSQNKDKVYERWVKHFSEKSKSDAEINPGKAMTPSQIYESAQLAAANEIGYNRAVQEKALQKQAIQKVLQGHLDKKDFASYSRDYDKLINLGSDGFTVEQLAEIGFLEAGKYRKDAAVDARTIRLK